MQNTDTNHANIAKKIIGYIGTRKLQKKILNMLSPEYLLWLNEKVSEILKAEPNVVFTQGKFVLVGDLHGQLNDLDRILRKTWAENTQKYLFLGDYVDRGQYSLEVISLLFTMKVLFPERVLLLRGNHESAYLTSVYGFKEECIKKRSEEIYNTFVQTFNNLPLCAVLNGRIFCVHGGISKYIETLDDIMKIDRFCDVPDNGPMFDLLWADPDEDVETFADSDRGETFIFGLSPTLDFLNRNRLSILIRGHECVDDGYEYPFEYIEKEGCKRLLTLFSASDYIDYENDAAYAIYDRKLEFHNLPYLRERSYERFNLNNDQEQQSIRSL